MLSTLLNNHNFHAVRATTREYLHTNTWQYFITLTFRYSVSRHVAEHVARQFVKQLNILVFTRRSNKAVRLAVILETDTTGEYHLHILAEDPISRIPNVSRQQSLPFRTAVHRAWCNAGSATADPYLTCDSDERWFESIDNVDAVIPYFTKQLSYFRPDTVLWDIYNLDGRRISNL